MSKHFSSLPSLLVAISRTLDAPGCPPLLLAVLLSLSGPQAASAQAPDLTPTAISPLITCTSDGNASGSLTVAIANQGDGATENGFTVQVTDGRGWTGTGPYASLLAAGTSVTVPIGVATWSPICLPCSAGYVFMATADVANNVAESNESNNDFGPVTYSAPIPDLTVPADTLTITTLADGLVSISGTVTLVNNGCGANLTTDVPMRFTLLDNVGGSGNQVAQWTQTLTGVNIPARGGSQVFPVTPHTTFTNLCANSTGCQVSIRSEADYTNTVCECDGTNNTRVADKGVFSPDLVLNSLLPTVSCVGDGNLQGAVEVNVSNPGCGDVANAVARLTADCGLTFPDQTLSLTAGSSRNLTFSFVPSCLLGTCGFVAQLDPDAAVSECDGTNNALSSAPIQWAVSDLLVEADTLALTCSGDGLSTVSGTLTLANNGCGPNLTTTVPVRFTLLDNVGGSGNQVAQWTQTLTGVNIPTGGGSQVFTIAPQAIPANLCANSTGCLVSLLVELDYLDAICELDGTNNTWVADSLTVDIPDLTVPADTLAASSRDGQLTVTGTVTLANDGCGARITGEVPVLFVLYNDPGCSDQILEWTETLGPVDIPAGGGSQEVSLGEQVLAASVCSDAGPCQISVGILADPDDTICECDGANNSRCADIVVTRQLVAIPALSLLGVLLLALLVAAAAMLVLARR